MNRVRRVEQKASERDEYAGSEEFARVFESERADLKKLALLLTADSEVAKLCLTSAFRDCIASSSVFKEWAPRWARRMLIRNAVRLVMAPNGQSLVETNDDTDDGLVAFSPDDSRGAISVPESILGLPDCERFVFVICVLEGYSPHDCALLLGKSHRDINEARQRVGNQVRQIDELSNISQGLAMR